MKWRGIQPDETVLRTAALYKKIRMRQGIMYDIYQGYSSDRSVNNIYFWERLLMLFNIFSFPLVLSIMRIETINKPPAHTQPSSRILNDTDDQTE